MWYLSIHTITKHKGHCYGNIPASTCPLCLLCFYSSHPRIVGPSFFFVCPSLPRVCESQLAVETTIQSVSHSPFFPLYILLCTKGTAQLSSGECVCVWGSTLREIPLMSYYGDGKYQAGLTWSLHDMVSWAAHAVISWLWFLCSYNLSMDTRCSRRLPRVHLDVRSRRIWAADSPGQEHKIT